MQIATCSKPVRFAFVLVMSSDFAAPSFFFVAGKCEADVFTLGYAVLTLKVASPARNPQKNIPAKFQEKTDGF